LQSRDTGSEGFREAVKYVAGQMGANHYYKADVKLTLDAM
jgi:hypothetical protein